MNPPTISQGTGRKRLLSCWLVVFSALLVLPATMGCQGVTPTPTPSVSPTSPAKQSIRLEITEPKDESIVSQGSTRVSGTTALDAIVSVNGNIVDIADNGTFATIVDLLEGPNLLEITASDIDGNTATKTLTVIYLPG